MFKTTCKKATQLSDKKQYNEINWIQIFRLGIHLVRCKNCRDYDKINDKLTDAIEVTHLKVLGDDEKTNLKNLLEKEMKNS